MEQPESKLRKMGRIVIYVVAVVLILIAVYFTLSEDTSSNLPTDSLPALFAPTGSSGITAEEIYNQKPPAGMCSDRFLVNEEAVIVPDAFGFHNYECVSPDANGCCQWVLVE